MNKISEEHLKTIQEQQAKLNQILNQVGYLEAQKTKSNPKSSRIFRSTKTRTTT
jgi:hypothetical protein